MEIMNAEDMGEPRALLSTERRDSPPLVSCNWQISNNKRFIDAVTTAPLRYAPARINCEDVASVDTCVALQPMDSGTESNAEPCTLNIEVSNCQRIARIAVVSEGNVLEIFKQFGEYETTILAEFVDEYEGSIVFLGETMINPPTTEVSIKFIRTKNKGPPMWVYGIRLFLTESIREAKPSAFDYDVIRTFLSNASNGKTSQGSEIAKKVFGFYDREEITRNYEEKLLETHASGSRYDERINENGRSDNDKEFPNCGDNYERSNVKCKNRAVRRDSETEHSNCEENYKSSGADIKTCIDNNTESIKKTKSGIFNYKDFIQTFLSNAGNGKMSRETDATRMFGLHDKFDDNEIVNEQFCQKILGTLTSDSDLFKRKNKIAKGDDEKDRRSCDEECTNREDYKKSDTDIKIYIDDKFHDMEKRLMEKIDEMEARYVDNKFHDMEKRLMEKTDEMEARMNQKLDAILERLETRLNLQ
ncbi:uncharacterized protein LOC143899861 [Temnothorax americanus]|uniref:uncharacterized protein LOC143899861 n=1 Tax=Temnothorax americanus TaxID=1964332 RepID=UPI0040697E41